MVLKFPSRNEAVFDLIIEGDSPNLQLLLNESGGHRWQRISPTERRGRVHTSTVTVVSSELKDALVCKLLESDITTFTTKDSGPGGQHRNKTETCVVMRHEPTKIEAKAASKSQSQNRKTARALLEHRVATMMVLRDNIQRGIKRKELAGSGQRGDKIRTYREQDDIVIDHRSGKKSRLKDFRKGKLE
jgi:peptide chain release factor 1